MNESFERKCRRRWNQENDIPWGQAGTDARVKFRQQTMSEGGAA